MHKEGMEGDNSTGEMLPNYSKIPVVNRIHSSYELLDAERLEATRYVEGLIAQGESPEWIEGYINRERQNARKDAQSQAEAVRRAIATIKQIIHNRNAPATGNSKPQEEFHKKQE